jgi:hypothetical protein
MLLIRPENRYDSRPAFASGRLFFRMYPLCDIWYENKDECKYGCTLGITLFRSSSTFLQVDASQDTRADSFAHEVLSAVPPEAILFTTGDRAIFALWYFHFALHERPDLAILAEDLLHFDWYQENLRAYPSLALSSPFPYVETITRANPGRAACRVQYTERAVIECTATK